MPEVRPNAASYIRKKTVNSRDTVSVGLQHLVDAEAIFTEIFHSEQQAVKLKETFLLKRKQEWVSCTLASFLFSVLHGGYSLRALLDIILTLN